MQLLRANNRSWHVQVADFGFAKHIGTDRTYTICGTPDYQAPEVIMRRGTTKVRTRFVVDATCCSMTA